MAPIRGLDRALVGLASTPSPSWKNGGDVQQFSDVADVECDNLNRDQLPSGAE